MRKTFTAIGIIWIIGSAIFGVSQLIRLMSAGVSISDIYWEELLFVFFLYASPGIVVLLLSALSEFFLKRETRSKEIDFDNPKKSSKNFITLHKDKSWIFLSYRRADSADISGRIYDRLIQEFGKQSVFKDVDSIPLGLDFRNILHQMVSQSRIFIAIIGPNWLGQIKDQAKRRIDDPSDFVRIEVSAALERGIPVIPLLVYGATMPHESELPEALKALAYRNGTVIRPDPDFNHDINRVISGIEKLKELPE